MTPMYIEWSTIITAGGVVSAVAVMLGILLKGHKWFLKQENQDKKIDELKEQHEQDVHRLKEENCLMCYAMSACLDGLMQLGCNHIVPDAKVKLDKYLNQQAHE